MMEQIQLPQLRLPMPRIIFGTASPGFLRGERQDGLLDAALEAGIRAVDTARVYGRAEEALGPWLKRHREEVLLITKGAHPDSAWRRRLGEREIRSDLAASLRALRTDRADLYLLHRDDPSVPVGEILGVLEALKREGLIGAYGASNWTAGRLREADGYARAHGMDGFAASSPHYSLARQQADPYGGGCVSLTGPEHAADRAWYREAGMPVLAYSSLGRGLFSGRLKSRDAARAGEVLDRFAVAGFAAPDNFERLARCEALAERKGCTVPQLALAWLCAQELLVFPVVTMSSPARVRENAAALSVRLTPEECRWLNLEA